MVSHPRIARRMTLVEGIRSKLLPICPNLVERLGFVSIGFPAFHELLLQSVHLVDKFLTHRFTQSITLASREVSQEAREKHDLLLIDRNAIRIFQVALHHRDVVLDFFLPMLAADERRDVIHRPRPVEGIHGNQIFELRRLQFTEILLHPGGFKLECPRSLPFAIELVGRRVFQAYVVDVYRFARCLADILDRFLDDGQGLQT